MKNTKTRARLAQLLSKIEGAYAPSTIRAYEESFGEFISFCEERGRTALPANPMDTALFIQSLTQRKLSSATIRRTVCAIGTIHRLNRIEDPTRDPDVIIEMRRMHRQLGRVAKQAHPITQETLIKLLGTTDNSLRGLRDRALLMVAYDALCRRSELVALQIEDINHPKSDATLDKNSEISILLRKSKTDPECMGKFLNISIKTYQSLMQWLDQSKLSKGSIFRGVNNILDLCNQLGAAEVNRIFKRLAKRAKLDDSIIQGISGHSIRVGAAQDLARGGASLLMLMTKGRWSKADTAMHYIEHIRNF